MINGLQDESLTIATLCLMTCSACRSYRCRLARWNQSAQKLGVRQCFLKYHSLLKDFRSFCTSHSLSFFSLFLLSSWSLHDFHARRAIKNLCAILPCFTNFSFDLNRKRQVSIILYWSCAEWYCIANVRAFRWELWTWRQVWSAKDAV